MTFFSFTDKTPNILEVLMRYPEALPGIVEVAQPDKILQLFQYKYKNFETQYPAAQQAILREALVLCAARIFKEHMERNKGQHSVSRSGGDLVEYSWNIYYILEKFNFAEFLNFHNLALKNIQHHNIYMTQEYRILRIRSAIRTLFACWVKYASICCEAEQEKFTKEAQIFTKYLKSNQFLNKNGFIANPDFFLEKSSLMFPLHLHFGKDRNIRLEKTLRFIHMFLEQGAFKNKKSRKEKSCMAEYEHYTQHVLTWLEKEIYNFPLNEQQEIFDIFTAIFKSNPQNAKEKVLQTMLYAIDLHQEYSSDKKSLLIDNQEQQWLHEVFRAFYLLNFDSSQFNSLATEDTAKLQTYIRTHDYLLQVASQYSYGKVLPLTYFLKTMYFDRQEIIKKYSSKYKTPITKLNLNLQSYEDFKTFVILYIGHDIINKSTSYARSRFLRLLAHQKEKIEKKSLQRNLKPAILKLDTHLISQLKHKKFKI